MRDLFQPSLAPVSPDSVMNTRQRAHHSPVYFGAFVSSPSPTFNSLDGPTRRWRTWFRSKVAFLTLIRCSFVFVLSEDEKGT